MEHAAKPRPTLAVTMGDPGGIGPEVIVKALADPGRRARARFRVYGSAGALRTAADRAGVEPYWLTLDHAQPLVPSVLAHDVVILDYAGGPFTPEPSANAGDLSFRYVDDAITAARLPHGDMLYVDALVTGPISKHAWQLAGHGRFPGHTELLGARAHVRRFGMMFVTPRLRVILVTGHVPLMQVGKALTPARILETIRLGAEACRGMKVPAPRIAVCGINPHAGEAGLLGDDEERAVIPAIDEARKAGLDATGPYPADTIFNAAVRGDFDLVVAMYHDQGLIPVKLLDRDRAVNLTVGLPFIRTSPDHGTAFDIAGANSADAGSMGAAVDLALQLCAARA